MMLTQVLRDILAAIESLNSTEKNRYVADHEIAERLGMAVEQVKDYLDLLQERDYVILAKTFGGYSAITTPRARLALQDPDVLSTDTPRAPIVLSGDFRNSILNIDSTLTNLSQIIDLRNADPTATQEIKQLIEQLNDALKQVPPEKVEDAEAVAYAAEVLIDAATKQKPNKVTVEISKEGLQKAAQNIASVTPIVLAIATQIVATIQKFLPK